MDAIYKKLKAKGVDVNFVFVHHEPDHPLSQWHPQPLLEENRSSTADVVVTSKLTLAWPLMATSTAAFLFDHYGKFIPGEYVVGLFAEIFLNKERGASIIRDPRVIWNTIDVVEKFGWPDGCLKNGHAFVKACMRKRDHNAAEMSKHHYFRDFAYCDSGIIRSWYTGIPSTSNLKLSELIEEKNLLSVQWRVEFYSLRCCKMHRKRPKSFYIKGYIYR